MSQKTEFKRETARQRFYREVDELKPRLPQDWKTRFVLRFPEYDSYRGGILIRDVYYLRTTDEVVLDGLRTIADEYERERRERGAA